MISNYQNIGYSSVFTDNFKDLKQATWKKIKIFLQWFFFKIITITPFKA